MAAWRKARRSQNNQNCVEVTLDQVRDSKNPGPVLRGDLPALLRAIQAGRFDR